ncbi:aspartyl protease family protein [Sphingobacterium paludis]|uniref:Aspartyl protease n=1 Tax=Sphingobacterium paludis TaxID=1476465 RepID=A0A4V3E1G2_9SPHI|nr:PDZ domain-containing protein [Sphingobacterium paludis]TDS13218.1 aspartyl protease [Sphingobacterium paludis]
MKWYVYLMALCTPCILHGQGIFRLKNNKPVTVKFELHNNVVLLPLKINGILFSFLLDTGVKETILFAQTDDSLYLNNQNKMRFQGIGMEEGVEGIRSSGNIVEVADVAVDSLHWLYVIEASELDISTDVGVAINGILGSKFFYSFAIRMDYVTKKMTLYPHGYRYDNVIRNYTPVAMQIENDRPYIEARLGDAYNYAHGKMLLDMGNTDPLMLFPFLLPDYHVAAPYVEEYIGRGFNGEIYGRRNRIKAVDIGNFKIRNPIVAYPDSAAVFMSKLTPDRIGSVGSQTLQRFDVFIDYEREVLFLRRNRMFAKPFFLNMAGMDVKHDGMIWKKELITQPNKQEGTSNSYGHNEGIKIDLSNDNMRYSFVLRPTYRVAGLRKSGPAALAGVQVGDELLKINGKDLARYSLSKIMETLHARVGETIRITLLRNGELKDLKFQLIDPIPYQEMP